MWYVVIWHYVMLYNGMIFDSLWCDLMCNANVSFEKTKTLFSYMFWQVENCNAKDLPRFKNYLVQLIKWKILKNRRGNRLDIADRTITSVCNCLSSFGAVSRSFFDLYFCNFGKTAVTRRKSFCVNLLRRLEITQCLKRN